MQWKRPHHFWWSLACALALLISTLAGGFSLRVAAVFVVIFAAGAALLGLDDANAADPVPEGREATDVNDVNDEAPGGEA